MTSTSASLEIGSEYSWMNGSIVALAMKYPAITEKVIDIFRRKTGTYDYYRDRPKPRMTACFIRQFRDMIEFLVTHDLRSPDYVLSLSYQSHPRIKNKVGHGAGGRLGCKRYILLQWNEPQPGGWIDSDYDIESMEYFAKEMHFHGDGFYGAVAGLERVSGDQHKHVLVKYPISDVTDVSAVLR